MSRSPDAIDVPLRRQPPVKAEARSSLASMVLPILALLVALGLHLGHTVMDTLALTAELAVSAVVVVILVTTVFVVLRHAEAIAHRIGEPYGTLVLTVAVTAIEASVIVSMMLHGSNNPTLARESVFGTVMIVCTGVVGICLALGGLAHREQTLKRQGTSALLAVLIALTGLTLVLPDFTLSAGPGDFTPMQLAFVSLLCVLLYGSFLLAQMTRHREDFVDNLATVEHERVTLSARQLTLRFALLAIGLIGIVLLAEYVAAGIEQSLTMLQVQQSDAIVGTFIATLVLLPEAISAIKAAYRDELQRSLNIALGSACATIGLTIPVVAVASLVTGRGITLGLASGDIVLLALGLLLSLVSFGTGRTNAMTGAVHLVLFVAFLLLIAVP